MSTEVLRPTPMTDLAELRRQRQQNGAPPAASMVPLNEAAPAVPAVAPAAPPTPSPHRPPQGLAAQIPTFRQALLREDESPAGDPMDTSVPVSSPGSSVHDHDGWRAKLGHIVQEILKDESMDPAMIKQKLLAAASMVKDQAPPAPEPTPEPTPEEPPMEPEPEPEMEESIKVLLTSGNPGDKELYESIYNERKLLLKDQRKLGLERQAESFRTRLVEARKLCEGSKLKDLKEGITDFFLEEVAQAKDEKGMRRLIENRVQVMSVAQQPKSTAGFIGGGPGMEVNDTDAMAKKIAEELTKAPGRRL